jgi:hypothetical protein
MEVRLSSAQLGMRMDRKDVKSVFSGRTAGPPKRHDGLVESCPIVVLLLMDTGGSKIEMVVREWLLFLRARIQSWTREIF